jgi:glyoxylase-like metal-dependent hydrolase (beta-lactamase superfamily II)
MAASDGGIAALRFPHAAPPEPGTLAEVAPGIHWLRMPLPFALNHINLWLLADGEGWTIVDSGLNTSATTDLWERIFTEGLDGKPVTRLIVTHFHPDHMGLAGWLTRRWQIPLWVTETEWLSARMLASDHDDEAFAADQTPFYRRAGVDAATVGMLAARGNQYAKRVGPIPREFHRIADGMTIAIGGRHWRVIIGRGHAPEHACLHCPELDLFIAGDQVLPKISPNISVWPNEPDANPLARYLDSLEVVRRAVPADVLVLPSHNLPFHGLDIRIDQLAAHHVERLAEIEAACAAPHSTMEIVPLLFRRKLDAQQLGFAIGEALAHVNYLLAAGRLTRSARADGVHLFSSPSRSSPLPPGEG